MPGLTLDARSDIYSMGTMLYEALTGQPPLLGANIIDTMQMHVESVPARPSKIRSDLQISGPLEMICVRALEKKPENRFKSMVNLETPCLQSFPCCLQKLDNFRTVNSELELVKICQVLHDKMPREHKRRQWSGDRTGRKPRISRWTERAKRHHQWCTAIRL